MTPRLTRWRRCDLRRLAALKGAPRWLKDMMDAIEFYRTPQGAADDCRVTCWLYCYLRGRDADVRYDGVTARPGKQWSFVGPNTVKIGHPTERAALLAALDGVEKS